MGQTKENAKTDGGVGCPCYVNAAEIQQAKQSDVQECLANCRAQFQRGVLNGWEGSNGWAEGCGGLNRGVAAQEFWSLYWCDSTFCGVAVDLDGGLGQDPSVDLIINTCQNIGFYSIFDPGPPPPGFKCSTEADMPSVCSATVMSASQATPGRQPDAAVPATSASMTKLTTTTTTAQPSSTLAIPASHSEFASSVATESPAPSAASTTSGTNITGQGRAAIAVCSALALVLLVCFAFVWLRRRKHRKESFDRALRSRHDHLPGAGLAGSPAVGTRGVLTPPLRLRDRKFLPSILRPGSRSPSPPLTPLTPAYGPQLSGGGSGGGGGSAGVGGVSPSSPNCSLATNKAISRSEHGTGASTPRTDPAHESASLLFTKAIPVPGSTSGGNNSNRGSGRSASSSSSSSSNSYTADGGGYGRGCEWSDGAARAMRPPRSRLETSPAMPSQPGTGQAPTETETGRGHHQRDATASPLPPPPPSRRLPWSPPYPPTPTPRSPSSPCRPPRPHEGMLEIPGVVTPAGSASGHGDGCGGSGGSGPGGNGKGDAPGFVKVVATGFVGDGSAGTPPPPLSPPPLSPPPLSPPPLSPPPSRTLPQTPKGAGMSLPPPLRGAAKKWLSPLDPHGPVSPQGSLHRAKDGWRSPRPRLLGTPSSVPLAGSGTDMNAERSYHDHGRPPPSYPPDPGQFPPPGDGAAGQSQRQPDSRGSWGSWSGTGTVVGSGSCHGDSVCRNADADADVTARAGTEVVISRRTSKSGNATATEDTMVSTVSRTSNVGHAANTGCAESQAR
ncbi:uncharacterized protein P884DRAFT_293784 [Thermothelomyces heterothallicus CBS 202.75]|uniref:uncharacterized protein n=1 Tax=Thermothelomyces heterothallicus CBS 202.75 TaxID=1149848 RepID=UPI003743489B